MIKIQRDVGDLCGTCRHLSIIRGANQREEIRRCNQFGRLPFRVTECSGYEDQRVPPIYQLEGHAWRLFEMPDGEKRFVSPAEFARLSDDDD
jgi:hypothetical protein